MSLLGTNKKSPIIKMNLTRKDTHAVFMVRKS